MLLNYLFVKFKKSNKIQIIIFIFLNKN